MSERVPNLPGYDLLLEIKEKAKSDPELAKEIEGLSDYEIYAKVQSIRHKQETGEEPDERQTDFYPVAFSLAKVWADSFANCETEEDFREVLGRWANFSPFAWTPEQIERYGHNLEGALDQAESSDE